MIRSFKCKAPVLVVVLLSIGIVIVRGQVNSLTSLPGPPYPDGQGENRWGVKYDPQLHGPPFDKQQQQIASYGQDPRQNVITTPVSQNPNLLIALPYQGRHPKLVLPSEQQQNAPTQSPNVMFWNAWNSIYNQQAKPLQQVVKSQEPQSRYQQQHQRRPSSSGLGLGGLYSLQGQGQRQELNPHSQVKVPFAPASPQLGQSQQLQQQLGQIRNHLENALLFNNAQFQEAAQSEQFKSLAGVPLSRQQLASPSSFKYALKFELPGKKKSKRPPPPPPKKVSILEVALGVAGGKHHAHHPHRKPKGHRKPFLPKYHSFKVFTTLGKGIDAVAGGANLVRKVVKGNTGKFIATGVKLGGKISYVKHVALAQVIKHVSSI